MPDTVANPGHSVNKIKKDSGFMELLFRLEETVQKRQRKCQIVTSALQRNRVVHVEEKLHSYFRLGVGRKEYMSDYRKMVLGWGVPELDDEEAARVGGQPL